MEFATLFDSLMGTLGTHLPSIAGALAILAVGWLVAVLVRAGVRRGLQTMKVNERIGKGTDTDSPMDIESGVAKGAFWIIMIMVLIAVFNALDLQQVSKPLDALVSQVMAFLPKIISAGVLALVAWIIATVVRTVATKGLAATTLDEKLTAEAGMAPLSGNIGNILFWLIVLLFLPVILGVLGLKGLLEPVQAMIDKILAAVPDLFKAGIIGFVGWLVAKIMRDLVTNLLAAAGADKLGEKAGLSETTRLSSLVGLIVFVFVFVPALIAAFEALKIDVITRPATEMLTLVLAAIPNIFVAAVILAVTYFVARFASRILTDILSGVGFDQYPEKIGMSQLAATTKPSVLVGRIVMFFAMLFASVEAANRVGFTQVRDVVTVFIEFGGQVILGSVILAIGFWIANLAHKGIIQVSGKGQVAMANIARFAIIGLVSAMGLRAMGIADDIVNMAFGLAFGAIAVAIALSFGLGGRDAAGEQMAYWLGKLRK